MIDPILKIFLVFILCIVCILSLYDVYRDLRNWNWRFFGIAFLELVAGVACAFVAYLIVTSV